jgi:hypothetical protein
MQQCKQCKSATLVSASGFVFFALGWMTGLHSCRPVGHRPSDATAGRIKPSNQGKLPSCWAFRLPFRLPPHAPKPAAMEWLVALGSPKKPLSRGDGASQQCAGTRESKHQRREVEMNPLSTDG